MRMVVMMDVLAPVKICSTRRPLDEITKQVMSE